MEHSENVVFGSKTQINDAFVTSYCCSTFRTVFSAVPGSIQTISFWPVIITIITLNKQYMYYIYNNQFKYFPFFSGGMGALKC